MIVVIIAGGSGTRLWPLSTPAYPKHLLALTGKRALVYYAYKRGITIGKAVYVLTEASHARHVKEQLPNLNQGAYIVEPGRRGTANCIIAALDYLSKNGHDRDEPIAFLAADHYIRDTQGFLHSFKVADEVSKREGRIVLVGAEPDYPATGFGYIQKDGIFDDKRFVFNVHSFKEKPNYILASEYVKSGNYLWNCGYFVGGINTFLTAMKGHAPNLYRNYQILQRAKSKVEYQKKYLEFSTDSIDYALIEKVENLLVVPASFDWMDLGSYSDLQKAFGSDENGNHINGSRVELKDVENSFIYSQENEKPVAVIGLDNVVVVNTKDGLLVARKDLAQQVGEVSKRFSNKEQT